MPIYEYKCPKCGVFEAMQRITEPSLKKCPTCKSKVERQMSLGSFVLKGSGWYATDYAKKAATGGSDSSESSGASATNGNASSSDSPAKPSGDSKPASDTKSSEAKTSNDSSASKTASRSKSSSDKTASAKAAD